MLSTWEEMAESRTRRLSQDEMRCTGPYHYKKIAAVPPAAGATLVGGRLAAKAAEESCSHGPELQHKNDLYFLLRLTNEAE